MDVRAVGAAGATEHGCGDFGLDNSCWLENGLPFLNNFLAERHTFVTNIYATWSSNQALNLLAAFTAK